MHRTEEELTMLLAEAATKVPIGSRYTHYKNPTHSYLVTGIAIDTSTNEPCIIYTAEYGAGLQFTRSLAEWLSPTVVDGREVERFTKLA